MSIEQYQLVSGVSFRDNSSPRPIFTINNDVIALIGKFRRLNPDIDTEFFNRELNRTLVEMIDRIDDEYHGVA